MITPLQAMAVICFGAVLQSLPFRAGRNPRIPPINRHFIP